MACGRQGVASQTSNWVERGERLSRALSVLGLGELRASVRRLKGLRQEIEGSQLRRLAKRSGREG